MQRIKQIDKRIERIKRDLEQIDEMRPGSISVQYRCAETKSYPYHQLNWVIGAKKQSEYVSRKNLKTLTRQTENYKTFKALCAEWVELGIERSKLSIKLERERQKSAS
ncbi:DUF6788 family protein [Granulosicoccus antarcticus]|uniref:DUF6788 domain-containing protein n=1 Tax=Granulosicoccus antarcticus IMCC3135 TaxID=1192854 RepID=A0A2Z2NVU1_9GAMM|nr:DUF6788 family protein [Granulosicoccus antarcticus]ASJ74645.1 hypothetical protein IMCC3135_22875 [Granulosicoccus antarcticus IMCC3135]